MAHTKITEQIIRRLIPGPTLVAERKLVRDLTSRNDIEGLRELTHDSGIVAGGASAVLAELERVAKEDARTAATNAEIAKAKVEGCPVCGAKIKRNNSLAGWWQCSQFGSVGFRADSSKPACGWQAFEV